MTHKLKTPEGSLAEQLRTIADNIEKVWAPRQCLGDDDQTEPHDNPLTEKMVFPDIGYTPADRLRVVAKNLEQFWGPIAARAGMEPGYKAGPDDPMVKTAVGDASALREVADLLDTLSKGTFVVPATTAQEFIAELAQER